LTPAEAASPLLAVAYSVGHAAVSTLASDIGRRCPGRGVAEHGVVTNRFRDRRRASPHTTHTKRKPRPKGMGSEGLLTSPDSPFPVWPLHCARPARARNPPLRALRELLGPARSLVALARNPPPPGEGVARPGLASDLDYVAQKGKSRRGPTHSAHLMTSGGTDVQQCHVRGQPGCRR